MLFSICTIRIFDKFWMGSVWKTNRSSILNEIWINLIESFKRGRLFTSVKCTLLLNQNVNFTLIPTKLECLSQADYSSKPNVLGYSRKLMLYFSQVLYWGLQFANALAYFVQACVTIKYVFITFVTDWKCWVHFVWIQSARNINILIHQKPVLINFFTTVINSVSRAFVTVSH